MIKYTYKYLGKSGIMQELKFIIAKNITELRKRDSMTQLELAEKLNYSDKAVSKWERGEATPDVAVLKDIADLFSVSLDYLVEEEHPKIPEPKRVSRLKKHNRAIITGISILLVWAVATFCFVTTDIVIKSIKVHWLAFIYAVPVSMVVWLVFNSIWFKKHRNFLIISVLAWSVLVSFYITMLVFGFNLWKIFLIGIPAQIIILMWSMLKNKNSKSE